MEDYKLERHDRQIEHLRRKVNDLRSLVGGYFWLWIGQAIFDIFIVAGIITNIFRG